MWVALVAIEVMGLVADLVVHDPLQPVHEGFRPTVFHPGQVADHLDHRRLRQVLFADELLQLPADPSLHDGANGLQSATGELLLRGALAGLGASDQLRQAVLHGAFSFGLHGTLP
jgi:hypothetical protein